MQLSALVEYGSGSVALTYFSHEKQGLVVSLFHDKYQLPHGSNWQKEKLLMDMHAALGKLVEEAERQVRQIRETPARVHMLFTSPFVAVTPRVIFSSYEQSEIVTPELVDSLISEEAALFEEGHRSEFGHHAHRYIENQIMRVKLNGYSTSHPYEKKAKHLEVATLLGLMPEQVYELFLKDAVTFFHHRQPEFHTASFLLFYVARNLPGLDNFLILHVGEELTDLLLVEEDVITESCSFPMGMYTLLRRVPDADLHKEGLLHTDSARHVAKKIEDFEQRWLAKLNECVSDLSERTFLSGDILIVGNEKETAYVRSMLQLKDGIQLKDFPKSGLRIRELLLEVFRKKCMELFHDGLKGDLRV